MATTGDIETQLKEVFAEAGTDGFLHVAQIDGDSEVGLGSDTRWWLWPRCLRSRSFSNSSGKPGAAS